MIRVYTTGVFDLFHVGHLRALRKAKSLGDYLLVWVHNDLDTSNYKRRPVIPIEQRIEIISAIDCVDEVIEGPLSSSRQFYEQHHIDIHCQGDDIGTHYTAARQLGLIQFLGCSREIDASQIIHRITEEYR
jgi:cytidyltransferase-like protein